jgi:hypothetical protein
MLGREEAQEKQLLEEKNKFFLNRNYLKLKK